MSGASRTRESPGRAGAPKNAWTRWDRLHWRLLAVHLVVLLVPVAGVEFARAYERELLRGLEADLRHQAVLTRRFVEAFEAKSGALDEAELQSVLERAARQTRLRIRILDGEGELRVDSHRDGPPEGPEPPPPRHFAALSDVNGSLGSRFRDPGPTWSPLPERAEVRAALRGQPSAYTRIRARQPSVILFVSEPILRDGTPAGVVYVTGSTAPVMHKLYRVREKLQIVLAVALLVTGAVTVLLAWSITRPLQRLAHAAARIAGGEYNLSLPVGGGGEIRELGWALSTMTETLRRRLRDTASFAADVAHGFKSPLTAIRGSAELLETGAADDADARARFLRGINVEVERLDRLVSQLLELSRLEASEVEPAPVDVLEMLSEIADRYESPDVRIRLVGPAQLPPVLARRDDLAVAFANLVDNALHASPAGGEVRLRVQTVSRDERPWVTIAVEDDGPGVPPEHRARLFERFFTTDKEQGTGLGLPIARAVVEAAGGRVYLDVPAAGKGGASGDGSREPTRFVVELPLGGRSVVPR